MLYYVEFIKEINIYVNTKQIKLIEIQPYVKTCGCFFV